MKKTIITLMACAMMVMSLNLTTYAKTNVELSQTTVNEIRASLDSLDIDYATQTRLITKLQNGEVWDSMDSEKINSISEDLLTPTIDSPIKRVVFEDGSVYESEIEFLTLDVSKNSDSLSSVIQPLGMRDFYTSVNVKATNGLSGGGFYADYYIDWNTADGITKVKDSYINVVGGSYSNKSLSIIKSSENSSMKIPAEANLTADISYAAGIGGGETFHLKMYVGNNKMVSGMLGKIKSVY